MDDIWKNIICTCMHVSIIYWNVTVIRMGKVEHSPMIDKGSGAEQRVP